MSRGHLTPSGGGGGAPTGPAGGSLAGTYPNPAIAAGGVVAGNIAAGGVSAANQIAAGIVNAAALADGIVTGGAAGAGVKLAASTVALANMAASSIGPAQLVAADILGPSAVANGSFEQAAVADATRADTWVYDWNTAGAGASAYALSATALDGDKALSIALAAATDGASVASKAFPIPNLGAGWPWTVAAFVNPIATVTSGIFVTMWFGATENFTRAGALGSAAIASNVGATGGTWTLQSGQVNATAGALWARIEVGLMTPNTATTLRVDVVRSARVLLSTDIGAQQINSTKIANATITDTQVAAANKDGAAGTVSMRSLGTGASAAAAGNDSRFGDPESWVVPGVLVVAAGAVRWYADRAYTIVSCRASVSTSPTGASIICDVNKNGTTIFTTQGNRPTIAASGNTSGLVTNMDVTAIAAGDFITIDVDQIGSTIAGSNLTVTVVLT